jgi:hypothetical protein
MVSPSRWEAEPDLRDLPAGRICPADYRYAPSAFDRAPELAADTLYVIGGLYGNLAALDAIERLAAAERTPPALVFNGDFHWFDAAPDWFAEIERRTARLPALRGNVETEVARASDVGAGCGCAYPPGVDEDTVRRSNEILLELRAAASAADRERLGRLPMHLVAQVGPLRVGIVHGDATSLAGWRFAHDRLDDPASRTWLADIRDASRVDLFASTHTCLAALRDFALPGGRLTIVNNGAAGMPNFSASTFGLITRIATGRSPHRTLYGLHRDGVWIDAIPLHYRQRAFLERFLERWPAGSPAYESYFERIAAGPDHPMARALA